MATPKIVLLNASSRRISNRPMCTVAPRQFHQHSPELFCLAYPFHTISKREALRPCYAGGAADLLEIAPNSFIAALAFAAEPIPASVAEIDTRFPRIGRFAGPFQCAERGNAVEGE